MVEALKKLPKRWSYSGLPGGFTVNISRHEVKPAEDYFALFEWAKKFQIGLEPHSSGYWETRDYDAEVWSVFKVSDDFAITEKFFGDGWSTILGNKEKIGTRGCQSCYRQGLVTHEVTRRLQGTKIFICSICTSNCDKCQALVWGGEYEAGQPLLCSTCNPIFKCQLCQKPKSKDGNESVINLYTRGRKLWKQGALVCGECQKGSFCEGCKYTYERHSKITEVEGVKLCPTCHEEKVLKDFEKYEKFRLEELPKGGLTIKSLPARPFRTISIETEVDGDRRMLCKMLYEGGLVRVPEVERYGSQTPDQSKWAAFLKHDGSVTGGELISFMLDLSKREHSEALKTTLRKLRALETTKFIEFNPNCGGHIHIDAHGFGTENIWRLLTVWNYLEDFTYRLAGAGHKYGHRTLVPGHDRANGGHGYANPTVKGPWGVKSSVGQAVRSQDRMCGLNFQPYLRAIQNCACNAYGNDRMRACRCVLTRHTIEWRVWNSQRNPRILHAWIAYMQAIHAFADVDDEPTADFEKRFPTLAWSKQPWTKLTGKAQDAVYDRIRWVFANLVLTTEERDSLIYAISKSDIPVTAGFRKELLAIRSVSEVAPIRRPVKFSKHNSRLQKIVIEAPKPGDNPLEAAMVGGEYFIRDGQIFPGQRRRAAMRNRIFR